MSSLLLDVPASVGQYVLEFLDPIGEVASGALPCVSARLNREVIVPALPRVLGGVREVWLKRDWRRIPVAARRFLTGVEKLSNSVPRSGGEDEGDEPGDYEEEAGDMSGQQESVLPADVWAFLVTPKLRSIAVVDLYAPPEEGFIAKVMAKAPNVESWEVNCRYLGEWGVPDLLSQHCPRLKALTIGEEGYLHSTDFQHLVEKCPQLEKLCVACEVEDSGEFSVERIYGILGPRLKECAFGDLAPEQLIHVAPNLTRIGLWHTEVARVRPWERLVHLKAIDCDIGIADISQVTTAVVNQVGLGDEPAGSLNDGTYYNDPARAQLFHEALLLQLATDLAAVSSQPNQLPLPVRRFPRVRKMYDIDESYNVVHIDVRISDTVSLEIVAATYMVSDVFSAQIHVHRTAAAAASQ